MAPSCAVRPAKKLPKPGSKFAALTPKSTGCSMADLSGARAQSCRRSWILRKPADTTSQHSTTMAATAESASAYNLDGRPNRGRSHFFLPSSEESGSGKTLKGVVANQMDRQLAEMAARQVSGVFSVDNQLMSEKNT